MPGDTFISATTILLRTAVALVLTVIADTKVVTLTIESVTVFVVYVGIGGSLNYYAMKPVHCTLLVLGRNTDSIVGVVSFTS